MRAGRFLAYAAAIAFFVAMQGFNVARQARFEQLSGYSRAVIEFLGLRVSREQYLIIYYEGKPIGYSGYTVQSPEEGGASIHSYKMTIDGYARLLPWLGTRGALALQGEVLLDGLGEIMSLDLTLEVAGERFRLAGGREGGEVVVRLARGAEDLNAAITIPRSLGIAGAMMPIPPLGDLSEGDTREIPYFDPLTRMQARVSLRVLERAPAMVEGVRMEVLRLDLTAPSGTFIVTASPDGDILKVEAPGGIELRQGSSTQAHRLFRAKREGRQ